MPFLCLVAKKWRKKGRPDFPSGTSLGARANDVALSLHSCLREIMQIQILRSHLEIQMRTRKAHASHNGKSFSHVQRTKFRTNFKQKRESKKSFPICSRFSIKTRTQDLNFYHFAKTLEARERRQFLRAPRVPRGNPLAPFFRHFLGRSKKWHKKAIRSARGTRAV